MSPPATLTGVESSHSQMVRDGLPNINLDSGKQRNQFAIQNGIWLFIGGLCVCFGIIVLTLVGAT